MEEDWIEGTEEEERELWMRSSMEALARIWDNEDDEIRSDLLKNDPGAETAPDRRSKNG